MTYQRLMGRLEEAIKNRRRSESALVPASVPPVKAVSLWGYGAVHGGLEVGEGGAPMSTHGSLLERAPLEEPGGHEWVHRFGLTERFARW